MNYFIDDAIINRQTRNYRNSTFIGQKEQRRQQLPNEDQQQQQRQSNRAAFLSTPIIPSVLSYIEKIGVGIRPKKKIRKLRHSKGVAKKAGSHPSTSGTKQNQTLDEREELAYFSSKEKVQKLQREIRSRTKVGRHGVGDKGGSKGNKIAESTTVAKGAHWLPPPPFSSHWKGDLFLAMILGLLYCFETSCPIFYIFFVT